MDEWINYPWGRYKSVWASKNKKLKILEIYAGHRTSLQYHKLRTEIWIHIEGKILAHVNGTNVAFDDKGRIRLSKNAIHRLSNRGKETAVLFEIQEGICEEEDIVRLEDDYGRLK